ncbi:glycosyltransferase family 2 protein [Treponema denticola]|uniref:Glycosyltransferase family 2 protein n=1 Tax=Treponema denticola TaxID=158 RepID=A0A9Q9BLS7_TREDN|nr:glycosyltransferase family 2 protein [Treponema denticola]UTC90761.1 glycosyltransferase family 2 protein [Treponema denticola]UTC99887.1 glycosyltransferase family 2 protein [Treponema denticola]
MKFSIIMPVYNTEKYLEKSILSVLNQSYTDYELICVNDGSTDGSTHILSAFADKKEIKIIQHECNKGLFCARKTGVQKASGDYILFLDSDDWLESDALKILARELTNSSSDYIEFTYYKVSATGRKKTWSFSKEDRTKEITDVLLSKANHTLWNKCYNANIIKPIYDSLPDFYAVFSEDYYQMVIIECHIKTRKIINIPLYNYRMTTGISNIPYFDNLEKVKNIDISLANVSQELYSFFTKTNRSEYMQYVRRCFSTIYLEILERTTSGEVINIIQNRFGVDGMITLLMQEISVLHTKIIKNEEEYRPLHIFAVLLRKPFNGLKRLLGR